MSPTLLAYFSQSLGPRWSCLTAFVIFGVGSVVQADDAVPGARTYTAQDTLSAPMEPNEDAAVCLNGLCWKPGRFEVTVAPPAEGKSFSLVRFPSPVPVGDEVNDLVAMEWYRAQNVPEGTTDVPAIVVVHESGRGMVVGRLMAQGFSLRGVHAFMIQLPYYGERRNGRGKPEAAQLFGAIRQAVVDVRRARDAVAVLPGVDAKNVCLQGTSLGGFVASITAGVDHGFQQVFLLLSGGNLYEIVEKGAKDAANVRRELLESGLTLEQLRELAWSVEPNRLAHRLRPDKTWLYSGNQDDVVPIENALAFAKAAHLDFTHHIRMPANHYSGIVFLPMILDHIVERVRGVKESESRFQFPSE